MTYPPQGPYGQQPDPYGQQPDPYGQQQPQYGGQQQQPQYGGAYQQQPQYGQQHGYDPNAQQQQYGGGYGQYGGLGGPPQQPKNKGPIIAVVAIVVVLLAGLGITGFVAPGFFLSDDKDKSAGGGTGGGGGGGGDDKGAGADEFIQKLVAAADDKDKSALKELSCSDAGEGVEGATNAIDEISGAELKDTKEVSDKEVTAILTITVDGDADDYAATVTKDGTDWCWKDIVQGTDPGSSSTGSPGTPSDDEPTTEESTPSGGATGDSEGEKFVQSFLDKLNAGDGAGAAALSCSDSTSQADITEAGTQKPNLEMDPAGTTADSSYVGADLKGTLNGAQASGRTSAFLEDGKWCIYTFFAS
jgi:hypothetical protein